MVDRRRFLTNIASGALTLGTLPLVLKCAGINRRDLLPCETAGTVTGLSPVERSILCLASLAPSGHNTQPWTIKKNGPGRWIIGSSRERWLPAVDPENRELLLSIGAFLENFTIAAEHYGFRVATRVLAARGTAADIAEMTLSPAARRESNLDRLRLRRTVRSGYQEREISSSDIARLSTFGEGRLHFFSRAGREGAFLAEGTIDANRIQAWRNPAQEELSRWIRWKDEDALRQRNGITPESMEITGMPGWFVRHFFDRDSVMSESFRNKTVDIARKQVRSCGGWFVLTSPDGGPASLLETGRIFQRIFLTVREMGVALHPMTQMLEESPWKERLAGEPGIPGTVRFILRTGYVRRYPDPVSLRMPLERIII